MDLMMLANEVRQSTAVDLRVVGVGGAGCASLMRLEELMFGSVNMLGIDTGTAASGLPSSMESLSIGSGFGSGGDPEQAVILFSEIESSVKDFVCDADVLIILSGLGRGTGSGLAPKIARIGKESGALTVAAVNMPFEFEGRFRNQAARKAFDRLRVEADAVIAMNNDDLSSLGDSKSSLNGAFQLADQNIANAVNAITKGLETGDVRSSAVLESLRNAGESVVLSAEATGTNSPHDSVLSAFGSASTKFATVSSAVIHVEGGIGLFPSHVAEVVNEVRQQIGRRAEIHVSSDRLVGMGQDIRTTIVLNGVQRLGEPIADLEHLMDGHMDEARKPLHFSGEIMTVRTRRPVLVASE
ncbi:MAG: hypothetical protein CL784_08770 [Chloroflexi bacterium]|nr:hypothetical protein [Chloroflexota bacterium]